jgi:hypothetical protein
MRSTLDDLASIEHQNLVAIAYRRKAMRDHDAAHLALANGLDNTTLGLSVKRTRRLVQDHDGWVLRENAGNLKTLELASAKVASSRDDMLAISIVPIHNVGMDVGIP